MVALASGSAAAAVGANRRRAGRNEEQAIALLGVFNDAPVHPLPACGESEASTDESGGSEHGHLLATAAGRWLPFTAASAGLDDVYSEATVRPASPAFAATARPMLGLMTGNLNADCGFQCNISDAWSANGGYGGGTEANPQLADEPGPATFAVETSTIPMASLSSSISSSLSSTYRTRSTETMTIKSQSLDRDSRSECNRQPRRRAARTKTVARRVPPPLAGLPHRRPDEIVAAIPGEVGAATPVQATRVEPSVGREGEAGSTLPLLTPAPVKIKKRLGGQRGSAPRKQSTPRGGSDSRSQRRRKGLKKVTPRASVQRPSRRPRRRAATIAAAAISATADTAVAGVDLAFFDSDSGPVNRPGRSTGGNPVTPASDLRPESASRSQGRNTSFTTAAGAPRTTGVACPNTLAIIQLLAGGRTYTRSEIMKLTGTDHRRISDIVNVLEFGRMITVEPVTKVHAINFGSATPRHLAEHEPQVPARRNTLPVIQVSRRRGFVWRSVCMCV